MTAGSSSGNATGSDARRAPSWWARSSLPQHPATASPRAPPPDHPVRAAAALLPGLIAAHTTAGFPALSAVLLTGGSELPASVDRLLRGMVIPLPVIATDHDTFDTATRLSAVGGRFTPEAGGKIDTALRVFAEHVDGPLLLDRLDIAKTGVITPLMFEYELLDRARARRRHIVLPEGEEPRILRAADTCCCAAAWPS